MPPPVAVHAPLDGVQLIEASAGTGKTWTIAGLYLRLIAEKGLSVDQVLTLSFTRAATAELRERIRARLHSLLETLGTPHADAAPRIEHDPVMAAVRQSVDEPLLRQRLLTALRDFDTAAIFTIHGFCQRALGERALSSGQALEMNLSADTDDDLSLLVEDFWRRRIATDAGAAHQHFVHWLYEQGHSPSTLIQWLRPLRAQARIQVRLPEPSASEADLSALFECWSACAAQWQAAREAVQQLFESIGGGSYKPRDLPGRLLKFERYLQGYSPFASCDVLKFFSQEHIQEKKPGTPSIPFIEATTRLIALRERAGQYCAEHWNALRAELLGLVQQQLPQRLREQQRQGFDDLLRDLAHALQGPAGSPLAASLAERYPAALIDEFQDTDALQWQILQRLYLEAPDAGQRAAFLVGDPKQAIYSFRGADVYTYLAAARRAAVQHSLNINQRSVEGLVQALNAWYGGVTEPFAHQGIRYLPVRASERSREPLIESGQQNPTPLRIFQMPPTDKPHNKEQATAFSVQCCVHEIARLLRDAGQGLIRIGARALQAGDIAVLVGTHRQGRQLRQALSSIGIASAEQSNESVFHSPEAEQLERLLLAIATPGHEGRLRAALATDLMGYSAAQLRALDDDEAGVAKLLDAFERWHALWQRDGVMRMLREWQRDCAVLPRLAAYADGERRITNLLHLSELLHAESRERHGLDALLGWLATGRRDGRHEAAELRLESDGALVQIVTIHRSKGLEYPVVFAPFLWFARSPGHEDLLQLHETDAEGIPRIVLTTVDGPEDPRLEQHRRERLGEQLRLAYVALTRARHRVYLCAGDVSGREDAALGVLLPGDPHTALRRLRDSAEGQVLLLEAKAATPAHSHTASLPPPLAVAPAPRLPPLRVLTSFTTLVSQLESSAPRADLAEQPDHDGGSQYGLAAEPPALVPEPGRMATAAAAIAHRFPAGARSGTCLHAMLEHLHFQSHPDNARIVMRELRWAGLDVDLAPDVEAWMDDLLQTPFLPSGQSLRSLGAAPLLREFEFHLPIESLNPKALVQLAQAHGFALPALMPASLSGFLKGFIDLVLFDPKDRRWWVADYKSNRLGEAYPAYSATAMQQAMEAHAYALQALLYVLALHRWLRWMLPDYDYARDIGGAAYLFLRGMRPDLPGNGVLHLLPPHSLIEALDQQLNGPLEAAA
jgi:exodeoxyribonuclease V beta subunit